MQTMGHDEKGFCFKTIVICVKRNRNIAKYGEKLRKSRDWQQRRLSLVFLTIICVRYELSL